MYPPPTTQTTIKSRSPPGVMYLTILDHYTSKQAEQSLPLELIVHFLIKIPFQLIFYADF